MPNRPPTSQPSSRFCPSCGAKSQRQWKFCAGCGEPLPSFDEIQLQSEPRRPSEKQRQRDLIAALIEEPEAPQTDVDRSTDGPSRPAVYDREQQEAARAVEAGKAQPEVEQPARATDMTTNAAGVESRVADVEAAGPARRVDAVEAADVEELALEPLSGSSGQPAAAAFVAGPRQGRDTGYLQFVALLAAALAVAVAAGLIVLNRRLSSFSTSADAGGVDSADRWVEQVFQPLFFVSAIVLLAGLAWWTQRRRAELDRLEVGESRFGDGAAAASWLIPGVNLVVPVLVLDELWRGGRAGPGDGEWDDQPSNPWLWAWAAIAAIGVVIAIGAAVLSPSTIGGTIDANTWSGIGYALIALALMVLVITMSAVATTLRISLRQGIEVEPLTEAG